jgi:hypothetical protein
MKMIIVALSLALILADSSPLTACDCVPTASADDARKSATLVFRGEVVSKEAVRLPQLRPDYKEYLVKFRVQRYWKGAPTRETIIRTPVSKERDCGYPFEAGKTYLVYAVESAIPQVTCCTRTALIDDVQVQGDLALLKKGKKMKLEE